MTVHVRVRVAAESYALPVEHVLEVRELGEIVPVPGAQQSVLGVINLRGRVLPVLDLAQIFGVAREGTPRRVVVAEDGGRLAGLAIDDVIDVGDLPPSTEEGNSAFLLGATLTDDALVGVIDLPRVLDAVADGSS
jgi:chemotaxis signal transduction protein